MTDGETGEEKPAGAETTKGSEVGEGGKNVPPNPDEHVEAPCSERPPPKQLSASAIDKRLRRLMTPRASGTFKVPQEVVDQWRDVATREKVMSMFEKCGYDPDPGFQKIFSWCFPKCFIFYQLF